MVHLKAVFFQLKSAQSFISCGLRELLLWTVSPGKPLSQAVATHVALSPWGEDEADTNRTHG